MTTTLAPREALATPPSAPVADERQDHRYDWVLAGAMLVLYVPLIFLGYGSDADSYLVVDSGRRLLNEQVYQPSRNPGYFLFESMTGVLSRLGGSVLSNAATLGAGVASLLLFLRICRRLDVPRPHLLGVLFVLHPVFWTNATCTMDYVWALALLLAGCLLLLRGAYVAAGIVLGLAIATRSTSVVAVAVLLGYALLARPGVRGRVALAGVIAVAVGALFYIPPFRQAGYSPAFMAPMIGGAELWTLKLRVARFVYKNIYYWGLLATLLLPVLALLAGRSWLDPARRRLVLACAGIVAAYQVLFFKFPIDLGYLLPLLPAVLILLGVGLAQRPLVLKAFAVALGSYAVVNFNVARPDRADRATGGSVGLWVEPGLVLQDARERHALRHCDTFACWEATTQQTGSPQ